VSLALVLDEVRLYILFLIYLEKRKRITAGFDREFDDIYLLNERFVTRRRSAKPILATMLTKIIILASSKNCSKKLIRKKQL